jgi:cytochrome c-type biogenesis protein CcmH
MAKQPLRITQYVILLMAFSFTFFTLSSSSAQGPTPTDDEVNRIAKQLYCPVCENTPLDVCPTEACRQWREQIREMLIEGKSEEEIIDYFAVTYGERAAGDPRNKLEAYLIPFVVILLGTVLLVSALRMWKKPIAATPPLTENKAKRVRQDDYVARLEEELKKRQ